MKKDRSTVCIQKDNGQFAELLSHFIGISDLMSSGNVDMFLWLYFKKGKSKTMKTQGEKNKIAGDRASILAVITSLIEFEKI